MYLLYPFSTSNKMTSPVDVGGFAEPRKILLSVCFPSVEQLSQHHRSPEFRPTPSLSMYLILSENELTGSLPIEMEKLVNLGYLDVSKNRLSGEIPESLGSCVSLESLHLEENFLQGPIPNTLSSLRAIQELNLSSNNLTGQIPEFLENFKLLESLDLSFNDFEGEVPVQGAFQNTSAISIFGNKKLCGGIPQLNLTRCPSSEPTNSKSPTKLLWIIGSVCGFLGVILIISFLLFYCFRKKKDKPAASQPSLETSFPRVAYEDLLGATDGFSSANLIGEGSFGSVFKGILGPDNIVVAVKVLNLLRKGASKSFMAECEALKSIRHPNLVKLLTTCSSIDFQGNDFKALVYEFMVNGSLEEWLHPVQTSDEASEPKALDLMHRLNIAIHVASALNYLHHDCQMPIIHCDLKPSNILLDTNMTAHVGDFGLARFHSEASNQTSSVGLKGTIGYAAPEYGIGGKVSTYGDVYSYGILLLEMFTGKRPVDGMFKDGLNLHNYAKMALPDRIVEVVDPLLVREIRSVKSSDEMDLYHIGPHEIFACLMTIIKMGVACSVELPRERMDIGDVVPELNRIKNTLLGTKMHRQT